ncbi:MAG: hypothetical protein HY720_11390 [Planctomycetes bacterium]|nr:hypothetical protein [Planctomycetota bacterium]
MTSIPEGWTDDMSIVLPSALTVEMVVDVVLGGEARKASCDLTHAKLVSLGLSEGDAHLAHDRALGGLVRAATGNPANEPSKEKDPVAWASYRRCSREPALIAAIRPDFGIPSGAAANGISARKWWQFWK